MRSKLAALVIEFDENARVLDGYEKCKLASEKIVKIGEEQHCDLIKARGLVRLAYVEIRFSKWRNGWDVKLAKAEELCGDDPTLARAELLMYRGYINGNWQSDFESGIAQLNQAIRIGEQINNDILLTKSYSILAQLLIYVEQPALALEYAFKSKILADKIGNLALRKTALSRLTQVHVVMNCQQLAVDYAKELRGCGQRTPQTEMLLLMSGEPNDYEEMALKNIEKLENVEDLSPVQIHFLAKELHRLAHVRKRQNRYDEAIELLHESKRLFLQSNSDQDAFNTDRTMVEYLLGKGDLEQARTLYRQLKLRIKNEPLPDFSKSFQIQLHEKLGEYEIANELMRDVYELNSEGKKRKVSFARTTAEGYLQQEFRDREYVAELSAERRKGLIQCYVGIATLGFLLLLASAVWGRNRTLKKSRSELESVVRDRTQSLRQALELAEVADKSKNEFLARANHEIRNPLTAIVGYCELLQPRGNASGQMQYRQEVVDGIQSSSHHLMQLVNNLLEIARIEDGKVRVENRRFKLSDVRNDLYQIHAELAKQKGVDFSCELNASRDSVLFGDDTILKQILSNLIGNAIKFTDQGFVRLTISTASCKDGVLMTATVADSGKGIPNEFLSIIFDPFSEIPNADQGQGWGYT